MPKFSSSVYLERQTPAHRGKRVEPEFETSTLELWFDLAVSANAKSRSGYGRLAGNYIYTDRAVRVAEEAACRQIVEQVKAAGWTVGPKDEYYISYEIWFKQKFVDDCSNRIKLIEDSLQCNALKQLKHRKEKELEKRQARGSKRSRGRAVLEEVVAGFLSGGEPEIEILPAIYNDSHIMHTEITKLWGGPPLPVHVIITKIVPIRRRKIA